MSWSRSSDFSTRASRLIIIYTAANIPFVTWLLRGFFAEIPREVEEAALVDGYSHIQIFWRVALPLIRPGTGYHRDPDGGVLLERVPLRHDPDAEPGGDTSRSISRSSRARPTPSGTSTWRSGLVAVVPILIVTIWLQKHLVRGMTFGAVR